ncbi:DUF2384 domain-containing protein [Oxalobacteraceae bacterium OM1]|nr:DUF2384 domain-containing protein [Oxalobacteraceae bacterium OM1]
MSDDNQASPEAIEALRARFQAQSRRAQAYYTVMHRAREVTGSDEAANTWMNAPLPALDGKTPAQLVNDGREEDVLQYIDGLQSGS